MGVERRGLARTVDRGKWLQTPLSSLQPARANGLPRGCDAGPRVWPITIHVVQEVGVSLHVNSNPVICLARQARLRQAEKRLADVDEETSFVSLRKAELQDLEEKLHSEQSYFNELVCVKLGSAHGRADLQRLMAFDTREQKVSALEQERAQVLEDSARLQTDRAAMAALETSLQEKELSLAVLAARLEHALQKATSEQAQFESTVSARAKALVEKEQEMGQIWSRLDQAADVETGRKQIASLALLQAEHEHRLKQKEEQLAMLEAAIEREREELPHKVQALVNDAVLPANLELRQREEELRIRQQALAVEAEALQADKTQWAVVKQRAKMAKDAEAKLKLADERLALLEAREGEVAKLAADLDRDHDILRRAQALQIETKERLAKQAYDYETKVKELALREAELKQQEAVLSAQIVQLEKRERSQMLDKPEGQAANGADPSAKLQREWERRNKELALQEIELRRREAQLNGRLSRLAADKSESAPRAPHSDRGASKALAHSSAAELSGWESDVPSDTLSLSPAVDGEVGASAAGHSEATPNKGRTRKAGMHRLEEAVDGNSKDELEVDMDRIRREYVATKKQLQAKQEKLRVSLLNLDRQEQFLNESLDAERVLDLALPELHKDLPPDAEGLSRNLEQQHALVQRKELGVRHLAALQVFLTEITITCNTSVQCRLNQD